MVARHKCEDIFKTGGVEEGLCECGARVRMVDGTFRHSHLYVRGV